MLREIYCEEFYQKRVEFNDDFNVLLILYSEEIHIQNQLTS